MADNEPKFKRVPTSVSSTTSSSVSSSRSSTPKEEIERIIADLSDAEGIARGDIEGNFADALNTLQLTEQKILDLTAPAREASEGAIQKLSQFSNLSGREDGASLQRLLEQIPGYQFRRDEGQRAVESSGAARGLLESGAIAKELTRFGQGFASSEFGAEQSRLIQLINATTPQVQAGIGAVQQSGTNQAALQQNQGSSLAGISQSAAGQRASALTQLATRDTQTSQANQSETTKFDIVKNT